jgi:hypothetical protein
MSAKGATSNPLVQGSPGREFSSLRLWISATACSAEKGRRLLCFYKNDGTRERQAQRRKEKLRAVHLDRYC